MPRLNDSNRPLRNLVLAFLLLPFIAASASRAAETGAPTPAKSSGLPIAELKRETPVDFEKEVLPFLKNNCLACHNTTKAKAGLNLETPQLMLKGGDTGPALVPGQSTNSLVFKAAAHRDAESIMPPKDNKANASNLTPAQLALLQLWIDQGAKGEVRAATPVQWLEKPPVLDPIFAVALTQDGQFAACGRGNRIDVYHIPSGQFLARLVDPGLTNVAHRDLINALAFHPDGTLLASASYREVKLWRRPREAQRALPALTNVAALFAISADRRWLATTTADHAIALFDLASSQLARTLTGHSNRVTSLKFSPDSTHLASGSTDKTLRVWHVADGASVATAETPGEVHATRWLADSRRLASGGEDGVIRVLELRDLPRDPAVASAQDNQTLGALVTKLVVVKELKAHTNAITALDTLAGGKELLSGDAGGSLRQWTLEDGKVLRELQHGGTITALVARPDGKVFASAGTNHLAKLWNAADGKPIAEMKGDRYAIERVAATERSLVVAKMDVEFRKKSLETATAEHKKQTERVATASTTNSANEKIFAEKDKLLKEAQTARTDADKALTNLLADIEKVTKDFESAQTNASAAALQAKAVSEKAGQAQLAAERAAESRIDAEKLALDTASVATRTSKALTTTADAAKDTAKRIADESVGVAEKSKAFAQAVVADADMKIKLAAEAKAATDKAIEEVAALAFAAGQLKPGYDKTLAEAPEKRKAATNQVTATTKALTSAEAEFKKSETRKSVTGHELELAQQAQKRATEVLESAKTGLAAVETAQKETEAALDRAKKAAAAAEQPVRALAFSPDGRTVATVGDDRRIHTWSAETGAAFDVVGAAAEGVAFLDDRTLLATVEGQRLATWDLQPAWTLERTIGTGDIDSPLADRVNAVSFSPDGLTLATGAGEPTRSGEIKLWNVADGKLKREFAGVHSDAVLALEFSPDGKSLASSSADRFVRVTDLASGTVVKALEGHTSYVLGVAWKCDSRTLASAGADNVIKVWDVVTGDRKKNIEGAGKEVTSIRFVGATGEAVASSGDGQVRLLRENGEKVRAFEGATDFMNSATATPDGRVIVAGGQDGVLRVWNGSTGESRGSFAPSSIR